ncbi:MAG: flippase-like domain-containing protein [Candidatus Marinimicrobia bacterium]|nr:flippase-like domain-containing protein [Candidatus Neomarinimicrobiota bacterium]
MKKKLFLNYKSLIGLLISFLGLYLGFRKFDIEEFFDAMASANLLYFLAAMAIMVFLIFLRAWRWKYILAPVKKIALRRTFATEMIGYFGNNVFPLRLGELLRSYSLGKSEEISSVTAFGTIVVERSLDTLAFVVIMLIGAMTYENMPDWVQQGAQIGIIGFGVLLIILVVLILNKKNLEAFIENKFGKYSDTKIFQFLENLIHGLVALKRNPYTVVILAQSLLIMVVNIFFFWVIGLIFGNYLALSAVLLIYFVTSAVIAVPSSPGYVGTYHAGAIGILQVLGFGLSEAQALAVIMHAAGFIPLTIIGGIYFMKYHININEFEKESVVKKEQSGDLSK